MVSKYLNGPPDEGFIGHRAIVQIPQRFGKEGLIFGAQRICTCRLGALVVQSPDFVRVEVAQTVSFRTVDRANKRFQNVPPIQPFFTKQFYARASVKGRARLWSEVSPKQGTGANGKVTFTLCLA